MEITNQDITIKEITTETIATTTVENTANTPVLQLDFSVPPKPILYADEFVGKTKDNYNIPKGLKWSPDGSCLLACGEDNQLRVFELPQLDFNSLPGISPFANPGAFRSVLRIPEGETVYDYAWYPGMISSNPTTCCFISTSKDRPVHMWDAFTGKIRCSYRAYDHMDELTAALSVSFNLSGEKIYCGYNNSIRIFDISNPGRVSEHIVLSKKKQQEGQKGLISCITFSPDYSGMFALGSYSNTTGIYNEKDHSPICLLEDKQDGAGITQVKFSPDGNYVFVGARKSSAIACWDLRKTGALLYKLHRKAQSNQRIAFDIDYTGKLLFTGSQDNKVLIYNLTKATESVDPLCILEEHKDAVNGVVVHPSLPLLGTASGQRQFVLDPEDMTDQQPVHYDSRILIWKIHALS